MRRRPVALLQPPEYPRPVMPAGLNEDQQDELLDRMMTQLMTGRPIFRRETPMDIEVRVVRSGGWGLGDDVIEF